MTAKDGDGWWRWMDDGWWRWMVAKDDGGEDPGVGLGYTVKNSYIKKKFNFIKKLNKNQFGKNWFMVFWFIKKINH